MRSPERSATSFSPKSVATKSAMVIPHRPEKNYASFISDDPKTKIKQILVAQPKPEGPRSAYFDLEAKYKVKFTFLPFVTVEGVSGKEFRKQRITLNEYSGIIFTSRNSIDHFFRICEELRVRMSQETKFFCTSEAIALYLQKYTQYRKRKVFFGDANNNKELRTLLMKHRDTTRFLYICAEMRKDEITSFMTANKFNYVEGVMYRTVPNLLKPLDISKFNMLILFSPTGIHSLYHSFPKFKQDKLKIAAYGTTTADAIISKELKFHVMAPLGRDTTIITALENYLKEANK
ncbi:MAG: uroporphyrinogen-III synthase [Bacteroidetes bacterium]|nr:uroporphyrinogen-III synthase [Bacteroidota bacterium]